MDLTKSKRGELLVKMCEEADLILLNGRSTSDRPAVFTYVGLQGESVIDLIWVNERCGRLIEDLSFRNSALSSHAVGKLLLNLGIQQKWTVDIRTEQLKWNS
ncbi:unnamed protein product, partial [Allacma fusca]